MKVWFWRFLSLIAVGLSAGALFVSYRQSRVPSKPLETSVTLPSPSPVPVITASPSGVLESDASLQLKVESLEERLQVLEKKPSIQTPSSRSVPQESFLYLGSGNTVSRDWTTIDSAAVTFDVSEYGTREVVFEAALSIVSGEVYARLAEKNSGTVYYDSVVTYNQSSSAWRSSGKITLPAGSRQYVVQLRSSNGERANLDGARLRITTK